MEKEKDDVIVEEQKTSQEQAPSTASDPKATFESIKPFMVDLIVAIMDRGKSDETSTKAQAEEQQEDLQAEEVVEEPVKEEKELEEF